MITQNKHKFNKVYTYDETEPLGTGGFGIVYKCIHKELKMERAVKIIDSKKIKDMAEFHEEIKILQKVDHPHILKMYEYFIEDEKILLVTEICDGGELFDRAQDKEITEYDASVMFKQILLALTYLHSNCGIAHRDIKPENFLFERKGNDCLDIKMIDFGLSKVLNS